MSGLRRDELSLRLETDVTRNGDMLLRTTDAKTGRLILAAGVICTAFAASASSQGRLKQYESKYYILHTDLGREMVREADARLTAMGEMYYQRTKHFGGKITRKLPFYLFSNAEDYYAAGGMRGSAGVYDGVKLMAIARPGDVANSWHIVQHEGFHQFVHSVIGGDIPTWVNEGLAEYFGEALFTGDGFVAGAAPPARLQRLQALIKAGQTLSVEGMMRLSHASWNSRLNIANYDQAWAMVYFLAHAENGRYQRAFNNFMKDVSRGMKYEHAWRKNFGTGTKEFNRKWRHYWLNMPLDASKLLYAKSMTATFASFLARALTQRQTFESFETFETLAKAGRIKQGSADWLPPALLQDSLKLAPALGEWRIIKRSGRFYVICTMEDGTVLRGTFKIRNRRIVPGSVQVTVDK